MRLAYLVGYGFAIERSPVNRYALNLLLCKFSESLFFMP